MTLIEVPLNISGFWVPQSGDTPETTGSLGASLTLEPPVVFKIARGDCPLVVNGTCLEEYHKITRELHEMGLSLHALSPVPLGVGAAVSGSVALALAYVYTYVKTGARPNIIDVGKLAHRIELEVGGGLGDVICQALGGGLVVRRKPGPPGVGEIASVPVEDVEVTLGVLGRKLTTREMLRLYADKFMEVGLRVYREFLSSPSLSSFLKLSREFSALVGFMKEEEMRALDECFRGKSSSILGYFVKKSLLVVVHKPGVSHEVRLALSRFCSYSLPPFKLARQGLTVLE